MQKSSLAPVALITVVVGTPVLLCLVVTNPLGLGPSGITLWFIGLFIGLAGTLCLAFTGLKHWRKPDGNTQKQTMASLRQGVLISSGVVITLGLASLRQLSLRDVLLLAVLLALIEFYFRTRHL